MIIVMKPNYTPQQLEGVVSAVKAHGLTPHITYGVETAIVAAVGEFHVPVSYTHLTLPTNREV